MGRSRLAEAPGTLQSIYPVPSLLIVLNVGLEMGVISPRLFAMMVLMALTTTVTTGPAL